MGSKFYTFTFPVTVSFALKHCLGPNLSNLLIKGCLFLFDWYYSQDQDVIPRWLVLIKGWSIKTLVPQSLFYISFDSPDQGTTGEIVDFYVVQTHSDGQSQGTSSPQTGASTPTSGVQSTMTGRSTNMVSRQSVARHIVLNTLF